MGRSGLPDTAASRIDDARFVRARDRLADLAERLDDDQVLDLADSLHDLLRRRRGLRARVAERLERKLCAGGAALS